MRSFFTITNDENESCNMYMAHFRESAQTLDLSGCLGLIHPALKYIELKEVMEGKWREFKDAKYENIDQYKTTPIEYLKAVCFLEGADPKRYYGLYSKLHDGTLKGHTNFLKTVWSILIW